MREGRTEPWEEHCDPHIPPLDDERDSRFLDKNDPRRIAIEEKAYGIEKDLDSES